MPGGVTTVDLKTAARVGFDAVRPAVMEVAKCEARHIR
jgi:hypothetical protein